MTEEHTSSAWRSFRFRRQIGSGGFGEVYQAELVTAGGFAKVVAVKLLKAEVADEPELLGRMRDEARLLGQLRHPAIVQADDLVFLAGRLAVVMEYVHGVNLIPIIDPRKNPDTLPATVILPIIRRVADALDAAWSRPSTLTGQPMHVLHRDIKPSNIQVTPDGEVKVLDFGVARADAMDRETSTQDQLIGSLPYIAPEIFLQLPPGSCTDIYSLGVVFYEAMARTRFGRCGLQPDQHRDLVAEKLGLLDPAPWGDSFGEVSDLLSGMLSFEADDRPGAGEVADRCRELERKVEGPMIEVWARQNVERLLDQQAGSEGGALEGQILQEDTTTRSFATPSQVPAAPESDEDLATDEVELEPVDDESSSGDDDLVVPPPPSEGRSPWSWVGLAGGPALALVVILLVLVPWQEILGPEPPPPGPAGQPAPPSGEPGADAPSPPPEPPRTASGAAEAGEEPGGDPFREVEPEAGDPPSDEGSASEADPLPGDGGDDDAGSADPDPASPDLAPTGSSGTSGGAADETSSSPGSSGEGSASDAAEGSDETSESSEAGTGASPPGGPAVPEPEGDPRPEATPDPGAASASPDPEPDPDAEPVDAAFSSKPLGVAITVDGIYRGTTPLRVPLQPGSHSVTFETDGETHTEDVEVRAEGRNLWTYHVSEAIVR